MLRYLLRKAEDYYVGGMIVWSHSDIRAITFLSIGEAENVRSQLHDSDKITIEEKEVA